MAGGKWSKAGGGGDESLSSTELLTAGSAAWVEVAPLPSARNGLRAVTVPLSGHRCLKLLSTMMAMNGDETNESNTY